jgi:hypothetical protein
MVNLSGCGGSWDSKDDTPVCSVMLAAATPLRASEARTRGVKGRPADGISALENPACGLAKMVW